MDLQVTKLHVTNPTSFDEVSRVLGDELSCWPAYAIPPGDHRVDFGFATEMYALAGRAALVRGQRSVELRAGQLLRARPGQVRFVVHETLDVRARTPDQRRITDDCRRIHARMSGGPPSGTHGRFVPVARLHDWQMDEPGIGGLFLGAEVGPLATALFGIPSELAALHPVNTEALSRYELAHACIFQPTCGTWPWPAKDPVPSNLLGILRATRREELVINEGSVAYSADRALYDAAWALLADGTGSVSSREELLVFASGVVNRWTPHPSGTPLDAAIAALRSSSVLPRTAPPFRHAERVFDHLLSELWRDVPSWMDDYMHHPAEVPYPAPFVVVDPGVELSPQFEQKWQITQVRTAPEGALPESHYASQGLPVVVARIVSQDDSTGSSEWVIRWSLYHEFAEWRFAVVSDETADLLVERELLDQWD